MKKDIEVIYKKTNCKLKNTTIERANKMIKRKRAEWVIKNKKILLFERYEDIKKMKQNFLKNEERICFLCGKPIAENEISVDHIIPKANSGRDVICNYAITHKKCNSIKGKNSIKEVIEKKLFDIDEKREKILLDKEKEIKKKLGIK
ncbi:MAG: hypothetical protein B6I28_06360 [Fusobacteriia bacterium 4572_132]|nr:MAG: hypothetical protein B6I28_06360 [Fusobacteriia bacterium 4572_132]